MTMTTTLEEANVKMRQAVRERLDNTDPADDKLVGYTPPPLAGCKPAEECAAGVLAQAWRGDCLLENRKHPSSVAHTRHGNGTTEKFGTGAVRSDTFEEFRYDLVSPIGLREVARACAEGAEKYGDWNWERGMPVHDLLNHAIAHIYGFLSGDRSEPHLGHAAWNLLAAIHSHELWPHLNEGTLRSSNCGPPA
jgi:hypothetical protein